ncbi:hypothetical protein KI387_040534, partial [Taxus chinensis]
SPLRSESSPTPEWRLPKKAYNEVYSHLNRFQLLASTVFKTRESVIQVAQSNNCEYNIPLIDKADIKSLK